MERQPHARMGGDQHHERWEQALGPGKGSPGGLGPVQQAGKLAWPARVGSADTDQNAPVLLSRRRDHPAPRQTFRGQHQHIQENPAHGRGKRCPARQTAKVEAQPTRARKSLSQRYDGPRCHSRRASAPTRPEQRQATGESVNTLHGSRGWLGPPQSGPGQPSPVPKGFPHHRTLAPRPAGSVAGANRVETEVAQVTTVFYPERLLNLRLRYF